MVAVLDAAASAEEESVAEFLKPHLDRLVSQLEEDPEVQEFLRIRAARAARREGKLSPIDQKKRSGGTA
jgi:hypothetical protein